MEIINFDPQNIDWNKISGENAMGETGFTISKIQLVGNIKIRLVEYSIHYKANHWCEKGHIVQVLNGELIIEHKDNLKYTIKSGSTYIIGDNTLVHKANSLIGAIVLIVD